MASTIESGKSSTILVFSLSMVVLVIGSPAVSQSAEPYIVNRPKPTPEAFSCGFVRAARIVGGTATVPGEFPWTVSIRLNGNHFCGGALIFKHWVLTAAHCVHRHNKSHLRVRAGEYKLSERSEQEHDFNVEKIIMHPNFVLARYLNDLALLRLSTDVTWDERKQPICLPKVANESYVGDEAIVAGWGWTNEPQTGATRSNSLQKLTLTIVEPAECQSWYHQAGKFVTINVNHMCAGFKDGKKDACQGDSGGPLMLKKGSQFRLIGVVSAGIGCARPLLPGLYTKVSAFLPWITENTKD